MARESSATVASCAFCGAPRARPGMVLSTSAADGYLDDEHRFETALRLLPASEQAAVRRRRAGSAVVLASRLLRTLGCAVHTGCAPSSLVFEYSPAGQPRLLSPRAPAFSVSRSGSMAIVYVREGGAVGADLASVAECLAWAPDEILQLRDVFSATELAQLRAASPGRARAELFAYYWSLKEAYGKFRGTGLAGDLCSADLGALDPLRPGELRTLRRTLQGEPVCLQSRWHDAGHVLSLCEGREASTAGDICLHRVPMEEVVRLCGHHLAWKNAMH
ncbi:AaceriAGR382Wp [[Ashbya] aceris (nom. inval.)]|nr:AaceriAGR382Wp [[Ashbya] aceris (nom. inval.)]